MSDLRVFIADDELLARQRIEDLLAKEEGIAIVGTAGDGLEAVEQIRALKPDLVFLDVQMPGMTGTEVAKTLGEEMPRTIFVTAYDQHAVKAFELAALDYLVKPFDDERFEQALRRARRAIAPRSQYLETIAVEQRGQVRAVPVKSIEYITASGPYAELHVAGQQGAGQQGGQTFAVRERMQTLEEQLDPAKWFRIHRSAIVRLDRVDVLLRGSGGDYAVRLKSGVELSLSRSRREELEERLGLAR
jgi:two-component system LytT family response regulator